jgi:thiol:disulfide interchange protein DsbG
MRKFLTTFLFITFVMPSSALAQNKEAGIPPLPAPLQRFVADGAQVRFLGTINGMDGWLTIKQGQEQYFYVTPDKKNFIMGLLFAEDGRMLTIDQVQKLREGEGEVLDLLVDGQLTRPRLDEVNKGVTENKFEVKSPSEQLYGDIENSNWIPLGSAEAPFIYTIIDPQCPHCHAFLKDLETNYIKAGKIQVRVVPIGLRDETKAQAAFLLAAPNPEETLFRHLNVDETALPAKSGLNQQGVQYNMSVVENWRFDATPITVYRDKAGVIKIIRGRAEDIGALMSDIQ